MSATRMNELVNKMSRQTWIELQKIFTKIANIYTQISQIIKKR